jgi:hypothetical protein
MSVLTLASKDSLYLLAVGIPLIAAALVLEKPHAFRSLDLGVTLYLIGGGVVGAWIGLVMGLELIASTGAWNAAAVAVPMVATMLVGMLGGGLAGRTAQLGTARLGDRS